MISRVNEAKTNTASCTRGPRYHTTRNVTSCRRDHGRFLWTENDPQGSRVTTANGRGHRGNHDRGSGYHFVVHHCSVRSGHNPSIWKGETQSS